LSQRIRNSTIWYCTSLLLLLLLLLNIIIWSYLLQYL